jgi:hypothetical protein
MGGGGNPAVAGPQAVSSEWDVVVAHLVNMGLLQNVSDFFVARCTVRQATNSFVVACDSTSAWACCKHTSKHFPHKSLPDFRLRTVSFNGTSILTTRQLLILMLSCCTVLDFVNAVDRETTLVSNLISLLPKEGACCS